MVDPMSETAWIVPTLDLDESDDVLMDDISTTSSEDDDDHEGEDEEFGDFNFTPLVEPMANVDDISLGGLLCEESSDDFLLDLPPVEFVTPGPVNDPLATSLPSLEEELFAESPMPPATRATSLSSTSSSTSSLSTSSSSSSSSSVSLSPRASSDLLQTQYQQAVEQLAASMKRSAETRQQIIRNQLSMPSWKPTSSSDFFLGSRSTLTAGLEQSRTMLLSYMQQLDTL